MKNARNRRKFKKYAARIFKVVKSTEIKSMTNQIAIISNNLNVEFKKI